MPHLFRAFLFFALIITSSMGRLSIGGTAGLGGLLEKISLWIPSMLVQVFILLPVMLPRDIILLQQMHAVHNAFCILLMTDAVSVEGNGTGENIMEHCLRPLIVDFWVACKHRTVAHWSDGRSSALNFSGQHVSTVH